MKKLIPNMIMGHKIEIMRFQQGKLYKKNVELYAKLCANSNKK